MAFLDYFPPYGFLCVFQQFAERQRRNSKMEPTFNLRAGWEYILVVPLY
jgi:hypothetical protein